MPVFNVRNRVQILRDMVARVVARSDLSSLTRNSSTFHVLAASADEDAEQYFQMSNLRLMFSIDNATGSDLDERAKEILPAVIRRRGALFGSGFVTFSRPGTSGVVTIPQGSVVAAQDSQGLIRYRTTATGTIAAGSLVSGLVAVVAIDAGDRGNVISGEIDVLASSIVGVTGVTNPNAILNGRSRESDQRFRARLKAFVQAISRGTVFAIRGYALTVQLDDGRTVLFAQVFEPTIPTGTIECIIDDGTGNVGSTSDINLDHVVLEGGLLETVLASALEGDTDVFTHNKPWVASATYPTLVYVNGVLKTEGELADYVVNETLGQITFTGYTLLAGDKVEVDYAYYTGLIGETQKVIDGDASDQITYPGVRAGGIKTIVRGAEETPINLNAVAIVMSGFDVTTVQAEVEEVISEYINNLDIGEDVIAAEIVERAMKVTGMFDFRITLLNVGIGNVVILPRWVARTGNISIG